MSEQDIDRIADRVVQKILIAACIIAVGVVIGESIMGSTVFGDGRARLTVALISTIGSIWSMSWLLELKR